MSGNVTASLQNKRRACLALVVLMNALILVAAATMFLLPTGIFNRIPLWVFGFLIAFKTIIALFVAVIAVGVQPRQPIASLSLGVGYVQGRFFGMVVGGILGGVLGGIIGAIAGLLAGTILVGRGTARMSSYFGEQLARKFALEENAG